MKEIKINSHFHHVPQRHCQPVMSWTEEEEEEKITSITADRPHM